MTITNNAATYLPPMLQQLAGEEASKTSTGGQAGAPGSSTGGGSASTGNSGSVLGKRRSSDDILKAFLDSQKREFSGAGWAKILDMVKQTGGAAIANVLRFPGEDRGALKTSDVVKDLLDRIYRRGESQYLTNDDWAVLGRVYAKASKNTSQNLPPDQYAKNLYHNSLNPNSTGEKLSDLHTAMEQKSQNPRKRFGPTDRQGSIFMNELSESKINSSASMKSAGVNRNHRLAISSVGAIAEVYSAFSKLIKEAEAAKRTDKTNPGGADPEINKGQQAKVDQIQRLMVDLVKGVTGYSDADAQRLLQRVESANDVKSFTKVVNEIGNRGYNLRMGPGAENSDIGKFFDGNTKADGNLTPRSDNLQGILFNLQRALALVSAKSTYSQNNVLKEFTAAAARVAEAIRTPDYRYQMVDPSKRIRPHSGSTEAAGFHASDPKRAAVGPVDNIQRLGGTPPSELTASFNDNPTQRPASTVGHVSDEDYVKQIARDFGVDSDKVVISDTMDEKARANYNPDTGDIEISRRMINELKEQRNVMERDIAHLSQEEQQVRRDAFDEVARGRLGTTLVHEASHAKQHQALGGDTQKMESWRGTMEYAAHVQEGKAIDAWRAGADALLEKAGVTISNDPMMRDMSDYARGFNEYYADAFVKEQSHINRDGRPTSEQVLDGVRSGNGPTDPNRSSTNTEGSDGKMLPRGSGSDEVGSPSAPGDDYLTKPSSEAIGDRIQALRKEHGLTQNDLARESGLTPETISKIEQGKLPATVSSLDSIVNALPVSQSEFFSTIPEHDPARANTDKPRTSSPSGDIFPVADEVEVVGIKETSKSTPTNVEMFRKIIDRGDGHQVGYPESDRRTGESGNLENPTTQPRNAEPPSDIDSDGENRQVGGPNHGEAQRETGLRQPPEESSPQRSKPSEESSPVSGSRGGSSGSSPADDGGSRSTDTDGASRGGSSSGGRAQVGGGSSRIGEGGENNNGHVSGEYGVSESDTGKTTGTTEGPAYAGSETGAGASSNASYEDGNLNASANAGAGASGRAGTTNGAGQYAEAEGHANASAGAVVSSEVNEETGHRETTVGAGARATTGGSVSAGDENDNVSAGVEAGVGVHSESTVWTDENGTVTGGGASFGMDAGAEAEVSKTRESDVGSGTATFTGGADVGVGGGAEAGMDSEGNLRLGIEADLGPVGAGFEWRYDIGAADEKGKQIQNDWDDGDYLHAVGNTGDLLLDSIETIPGVGSFVGITRDGIKELIDLVDDNMDELVKATKFVSKHAEDVFDDAKDAFNWARDIGKDIPKKVFNETKDIAEKGVKEGKDIVEKGAKEGKKIVEKGVKEGKDIVEKGAKEGKKIVDKGIDEGKKAVDKGVDQGKKAVDKGKDVVDKGADAVEDGADWVGDKTGLW